MKNPGFHSKSFKEGIEILMDEIELAVRWQRPSILLAIHPTRAEQPKAQRALAKGIQFLEHKVVPVKASPLSPDAITTMCKTPGHEQIVFFVSGLGKASEPSNRRIFSALNMKRERLVEFSIRAVFWLTEAEAAEMPHYSPDFWAFRHRVVEFAPSRKKNNSS